MMGSLYFFQSNDHLLMSCNMNSGCPRKKKCSCDLFVDVLFPLWQRSITKIIKIFHKFLSLTCLFVYLFVCFFCHPVIWVLNVLDIVDYNIINRSIHQETFLIQTILKRTRNPCKTTCEGIYS